MEIVYFFIEKTKNKEGRYETKFVSVYLSICFTY